TSFDSGGDVEIDYVACDLGLGMGVFPELRLTHLIPKERLNENYFVKLAAGVTVSNMLLEYNWQGTVPVSPFSGTLGVRRVIKDALSRKGIRRRMYLAQLRSKLRARSIILSHMYKKA